jgi:hypothetical protein
MLETERIRKRKESDKIFAKGEKIKTNGCLLRGGDMILDRKDPLCTAILPMSHVKRELNILNLNSFFENCWDACAAGAHPGCTILHHQRRLRLQYPPAGMPPPGQG